MIEPHHLNPNHAQPLFTTVPRDHYDAVCRKLDTCQKECIRIAALYEAEKAKTAKLERELDNILTKLDNPEEYLNDRT